jgi:hypothetical protein
MVGFTGMLSLMPSHMVAMVSDVESETEGASASCAFRAPGAPYKQKYTVKKNNIPVNGLIFTSALFSALQKIFCVFLPLKGVLKRVAENFL